MFGFLGSNHSTCNKIKGRNLLSLGKTVTIYNKFEVLKIIVTRLWQQNNFDLQLYPVSCIVLLGKKNRTLIGSA